MVGWRRLGQSRLCGRRLSVGATLSVILATAACIPPAVHSGSVEAHQGGACPAASKGIAPRVAAVGETVCVTGAGFGSRSGQVWFFLPPEGVIPGHTSSWTDTGIRVSVPSSAATGPVLVVTAAGEQLFAGPLVIEAAPNGVSRITYRTISPAVASQTVTVTLTATSSTGRPVPDVVIYLTDGYGTLSCAADAAGTCRMSVTGYASTTFIALSGHAWTEVAITWVQPPMQTMSLTTNAAALLVGESATVTAAVKDPNGTPVPNQLVSFTTIGSAPVTLSASQKLTDASGAAVVTATSLAPGVAFFDVETDYSSVGKSIEIDWAPALVDAISPNHGPQAGGTSVTVSGRGLTSSAAVYFGPVRAAHVAFINSSTLIAVAPPGSGQVDVRVEIDQWASPLVPSDAYTYS
jgi:IPT/TIG domain-containing protein/Big-like domain-containing protein